jgi:hypothetical protein
MSAPELHPDQRPGVTPLLRSCQFIWIIEGLTGVEAGRFDAAAPAAGVQRDIRHRPRRSDSTADEGCVVGIAAPRVEALDGTCQPVGAADKRRDRTPPLLSGWWRAGPTTATGAVVAVIERSDRGCERDLG